jgi:uncharacterized membrane protein
MATGKWLKIGLCFLAVFVAGGITGSMIALRSGHRMMHGHIDVPRFSEKILKHLDSELKLSAEQKEKIRPIIVESLQKQQAIHEQSRSQIEAARDDSRSKIMPLLEPEQQTRLQEMDKKWKNRAHREENGDRTPRPD